MMSFALWQIQFLNTMKQNDNPLCQNDVSILKNRKLYPRSRGILDTTTTRAQRKLKAS